MIVNHIHHLALKTNSPEKLAHFYEHFFGLTDKQIFSDENGIRSVWYTLGKTILMIERCQQSSSKVSFESDSPGLHLLALSITKQERNSWKEKLDKAGIKIERESQFSLYFCDPDGNRLALSHYPES